MNDVIALLRELARKVKAGEATFWDYLAAIAVISQTLLEMRRAPIGAPTEAGSAEELTSVADELAFSLTGDELEVASEGVLATAVLAALLKLLLRQL